MLTGFTAFAKYLIFFSICYETSCFQYPKFEVSDYITVGFSFSFFFWPYADAYDALDPTGNITIKWDVMSWTPDGYVVSIRQRKFFMR